MEPCNILKIITPKKIQLHGLWLGPAKPRRVLVFVHGLGGSAFDTWLAEHWVDTQTAVVTFSNRGHDKVAKIRQLDNTKKGYHSVLGGVSHEVFEDCVDDIAGVVESVRKMGVKEIYLAGHSTGCQKSVYYASKKKDTVVKGLILLAPISDYAGAIKFYDKKILAKAIKAAMALVAKGAPHELLPSAVWPDRMDAQRFLSLYTPDSVEEVFSYAQPKKNPRVLKSVLLPILSIFAEEDEYADRPAEEIKNWFAQSAKSVKLETVIVPNALHGFQGKEKAVAEAIKLWIK